PKFVEHPICTRMNLGRAYAKIFRLTGDDIVGALSPTSGGPNVVAYLAAPQVGAKIVMLETFDAVEALRLIEREKITVVCAVPAQLAMMLQHPDIFHYDLSSVRLWHSAGAALPYNIGVELEDKIGGTVVQSMGAADWGSGIVTSPEDARQVRLQTAGKPIPGSEIKLVNSEGMEVPAGETGEITGRGAGCASGYYLDERATLHAWAEDGWIRFGDLGKLDAGGNLIVVGRKKDIIIRGGQNIYPGEVESLLIEHPGVAGAAVVGIPDPVMGERACAFLALKKGQSITFDEVKTFLKSKNIASYKLPEKIEIINEIPLAGDQKTDKKLLRKRFLESEAGRQQAQAGPAGRPGGGQV
ncbi:MAG: fatty acid--CoA ligase family protein, partial [Dehalococcoidia bacterium]|nr:fatty acid--CoA ligase family protein [Dehalococcoidia bacterium]